MKVNYSFKTNTDKLKFISLLLTKNSIATKECEIGFIYQEEDNVHWWILNDGMFFNADTREIQDTLSELILGYKLKPNKQSILKNKGKWHNLANEKIISSGIKYKVENVNPDTLVEKINKLRKLFGNEDKL